MPVPPKPASRRRRRNVPVSYGAATPVTAGVAAAQPELGIDDPHPLVESMWAALAESVEARFFSAADWQRVRWELYFANTMMASGRPNAATWEAVQHGLGALLISPADKRRAAIELKPPGPDSDAVNFVGV